MTGDLPSGSVVIASRGRPELLRDAVDSVLNGDALPAELIVVDQSPEPNDRLRRLAPPAGCLLHYIGSDTVGLSRANNLGARAASHDLLLFTHDDVIVEPTWYRELVIALVRHGAHTVVTGRVVPEAAEDGFAPSTNADVAEKTYEGRIGLDVIYPMNLGIHRRALVAVGGFDERIGPGTPFPAAEDNDLGYRLLAAGYRIVFEPRATVVHRAWRPRRELSPLRYAYGRGQGAFYAKHIALGDWHILRRTADDLASRLRRIVRPPRHGRSRREELAYVAGLVRGLAGWRRASRPAAPRRRGVHAVWARRLLSTVMPYRKLNGGRQKRENEYQRGVWEYLWGRDELARFSVLVGYCHHLRPGGAILEVGCGEGILQTRLHPAKYARYVGIDIAEEAIRRAAARGDPRTRFVRADAEEYEPDETFDLIVFNECLEYFDDPVALMRRYEPSLANGGLFLVSMFVGRETNRTRHIWRWIDAAYRVEDATRITNAAGLSWVVKVLARHDRAA